MIMDECHHAASAQAQQMLRRVKAKYVYGVSATPVRSDKLEKINYMVLEPIRHQYTPKEHAQTQGIELLMIDSLCKAGVAVSLTDSESEHFAVMDKKLVWHGGMNLLGREDAWDNLIRVESVKAAAELLEMTKKLTVTER